MKNLSITSIFLVGVTCVPLAYGYKEQTHSQITAMAVTQSNLLSNQSLLPSLGLRSLETKQTFPNSDGLNQDIFQLLQFGARFEDSGNRSLNHFFNPLSNEPLIFFGVSLTNRTSPDWALEDDGEITEAFGAGVQEFSYKDAREYLYRALTVSSEADRRKNFGLTFQTLGHIVHHIQDMAQPQHVRNDPHLDQGSIEVLGLQLNPVYNPSLYEAYTNNVRDSLPYEGPLSAPGYPTLDLTAFSKPRAFWFSVQGHGMAQFTNFNFVSAGTNFGTSRFNLPLFDATLRNDVDIKQLCANAIPPCLNTNLTGRITFFGTRVKDYYTGQTTLNPYASTYSIFDAEMISAGRNPVFTLNRFNFDLAHGFLIPRAVAYSAGLINYFFRGQLEITPPDEGIYGIVDHTLENQPNLGGFRKIKLKIKNVTPGGTDSSGNSMIEPIPNNSPGTLMAIAKFHRNNCYQADLRGEYGSPGVAWQSCRASSEDIVVSQPQTIPAGINQDATPVLFNFPNPIPINATDVYLQVVYRGPLGEETDAIIVATKDISEPTYVYMFDTSDQYLYCGYGIISSEPPCVQRYTFKESFCDQLHPELTYDQCKAREGQTFKFRSNPTASPVPGYDPASPAVPQGQWFDIARESPFVPVGTLPTPVGSFTRVAMLLDLDLPADPYLMVDELGVGAMTIQFQWWQATGFVPTVNQLDTITNAMVISRSYAQARGVYVETTPYDWNPALNDYYLLSSGNAGGIPALVLVPSLLNF